MLLALILSWTAVTQDCHGAPELAVTYSIWTETIAKTGTVVDLDGNTWNMERRDFVTYHTPYVSLDIAEPGVGGGVIYNWPGAIDAAGNTSEDPCP